MLSSHEQEMKDLNDVLYAMELRFSERESQAQQEFTSLMDELKNKVGVVVGGQQCCVPCDARINLHQNRV